ncbi:MAG TPA: PQQ-binding-like beta-propeller repeat protein [Bryobacteraceae bacterium]|jgi:quinoprotein glucose dehydrogenase/quinate dehydrogenase (quinone)|nr:PQQ-binding-like beta-propeller repeat protein [Bryobacteraceae bacterium]
MYEMKKGTFSSFLILYVFASGVTLVGLIIFVLGIWLATRGGSAFYLMSGGSLFLSGAQLFRRRASAMIFAVLNFVLTWIWALAEVQLDGWALLPRVDLICVLLPLYYVPQIRSCLRPDRRSSCLASLERTYLAASATVAVLIAGTVGLNAWRDDRTVPEPPLLTTRPPIALSSSDWRYTGHDSAGTRFSGLSEINRSNAGHLTRVWEYAEPLPVSDSGRPPRKDEASPLQIGDKLFVCLADNTVLALDAEDGRLRWRYNPMTDLTGVNAAICRGVAYYEDPASVQCPKRIFTATLDARLIALDADSGRPCEDFGLHGQISLKTGLGPFSPGMYYVTSPPAITHGLAVVGALVQDNVSVDEPSGVIRAFDAHSGKLGWAWDIGPLPLTGESPVGETYTRGTPNSWSLFSADEKLGLVYVPMGNSTPDFVGSYRKAIWERYSSSVVALDVRTGEVRWSFQLVRHDLWDYDVSAQPVLFDMPTENGLIPALIQPSKQGDLFVLDRRTGIPLSAVAEQSVPQTDVAGELTSRTQPFSVGMPSLGEPRLTEKDMWGISPVDQLWCRLRFRQLRYDGVFTPPSLNGSIQYPGTAGGINWGSVSIDNARHLMFVPSLRMASVIKLVPRANAEKGAPFSDPQAGTPFAVENMFFLTRLGVPCQRPPYALLTAIDLSTKKVIWSKAIGTAEDLGPLGVASHLPFTIGAPPVVGGPIATAGDVLFIGAVGDRRLRAIDSLTGRVLWSDKMPEGNQATPITYRAPRSGRQMLAFVSGGYADLTTGRNVPTHVVAYALH